ncbi:MAG: hypothetical protein LBC14_06145 [Desulfovibrio sp.]|nr:hypothetical protein [Desulfovibrio sp.]
MKISLSGRGSVIIVKVREKIERHSLAEPPDSGSLAIEEESAALQYEIDLPSIASLLKNAEQLLFLAYSARQGSADERPTYDLLAAFSRWRRESRHALAAIGAAAERIAGHLHGAFAFLAGCEELNAFYSLQECLQEAWDMRMFSWEGRDRFQSMAELSSELLEKLTGQKWPWGLNGDLGFRPQSEIPRDYAALNRFLMEQDMIWRLRTRAKDKLEEAKGGYHHNILMSAEMEKAERRNCLAAIPLMFRTFNFTLAPAASALQGEEHEVRHVRQSLEHLVSFSQCRLTLLQSAVSHAGRIASAAPDGDFRETACQSLAAAIPIFQEIANIFEDFHEVCDTLDYGRYLSFLPYFRLMALLERAQGRDKEQRRKFYRRLPVARPAFMCMTRMLAVSRLCAAYCGEHERRLPEKDSLRAFSAMSEEERSPAKLAASLAASLKEETAAEATVNHLRLLERKERILATLPD